MRLKNAFVLMRKDLDEFKKQKFLIGSIIGLPVFLGIVIPLMTIMPIALLIPDDIGWDIEGLVEEGSLITNVDEPLTVESINDTTINGTTIKYTNLTRVDLNEVNIYSCKLDNCTVTNSTIRHSKIDNSYLESVFVSYSHGSNLDGKDIYAVNSDLEFVEKEKVDLEFLLPLMINVVLLMFIVLPAALPTLIASYSVVGEKNNKSLEPLLATPTTDEELLAGKVLSAFVPTMVGTYVAFIFSVIIVDVLMTPRLGYPPVPDLTWILAIILLSPTACIMSILACVLISSKVSDVRAAQQLGGFVIMPVIILMLSIFSGFILLSPIMVIIVAIIYIMIDFGLFYFTKLVFNREAILVKWT